MPVNGIPVKTEVPKTDAEEKLQPNTHKPVMILLQ
jgi:hypothetical protein